MKPLFILAACAVSLSGCGGNEAPATTPGKTRTVAAPPPAPGAGNNPSVSAPVPAPDASTPANDASTPSTAAKLPPSVYEGTGSPAERAAAQKSQRNQTWLITLKRGTEAQKQQARRSVEALPAAERAEFDKLCQAYGVSLK